MVGNKARLEKTNEPNAIGAGQLITLALQDSKIQFFAGSHPPRCEKFRDGRIDKLAKKSDQLGRRQNYPFTLAIPV